MASARSSAQNDLLRELLVLITLSLERFIQHAPASREASQSLNEFHLFSNTKFSSFVVNWRFHLRDLQANDLQGKFIGFSDFQRPFASGVIKRASGGCFLKKPLIAEDRRFP